MAEAVHLSVYASQPDVQILCSGRWTTPKWGMRDGRHAALTDQEGVYLDDEDGLYTFELEKASCQACLDSAQEHAPSTPGM